MLLFDSIEHLKEEVWDRKSELFFKVSRNGKYGVINKKGEMICEPIYDYVYTISDQFIKAVNNGLNSLLIDTKGIEVFKPQGTFSVRYYTGKILILEYGGKYGCVNNDGSIICEPIYDDIHALAEDKVGAVLNEKWGVINSKGEKICPCIYDEVESFDIHSFAKVRKKGKWGAINGEGKEVCPCIYDDIYYSERHPAKFLNNFIYVVRDGKYGVLTLNYDLICECIYDEIFFNHDIHRTCVRLGDKIGYIPDKSI